MSFGTIQETGRPVKIKDEGVTLVNNVASMDFTGAGVTGSAIGTDVTENIPGAVGGITSFGFTNGGGFIGTVLNPTSTPVLSLVLGTITTATWQATVVSPLYGGTGIANNALSTLTILGAFPITWIVSALTSLILPTTGTLATLAGTETFTNKRITTRIDTVADSATPTPTGDSDDMFTVTALAQGATVGTPGGTPTNGQKLIVRILDNGTARALSWNAIYKAGSDVALPTTTVVNKTLYCGFIYNTASTKWELVAVVQNI